MVGAGLLGLDGWLELGGGAGICGRDMIFAGGGCNGVGTADPPADTGRRGWLRSSSCKGARAEVETVVRRVIGGAGDGWRRASPRRNPRFILSI